MTSRVELSVASGGILRCQQSDGVHWSLDVGGCLRSGPCADRRGAVKRSVFGTTDKRILLATLDEALSLPKPKVIKGERLAGI